MKPSLGQLLVQKYFLTHAVASRALADDNSRGGVWDRLQVESAFPQERTCQDSQHLTEDTAMCGAMLQTMWRKRQVISRCGNALVRKVVEVVQYPFARGQILKLTEGHTQGQAERVVTARGLFTIGRTESW